MNRDTLRTSQIPDEKIAIWQLLRCTARIVRVRLVGESFTAYRLPSRVALLDAQPGTIMFDTYPDLVDARELLPKHGDLWDVVREDYWAALLNMVDLPTRPTGV
jgi:hypothetical protein